MGHPTPPPPHSETIFVQVEGSLKYLFPIFTYYMLLNCPIANIFEPKLGVRALPRHWRLPLSLRVAQGNGAHSFATTLQTWEEKIGYTVIYADRRRMNYGLHFKDVARWRRRVSKNVAYAQICF